MSRRLTESEWRFSTDPQAMLEFLQNEGKATDRKLLVCGGVL